MAQVSYPDFVCEKYIDIINERPRWSTRHPPPNTAAAASPPSQFRVNFTFSCESHYAVWVESEDSPPHVLSQYSRPETEKSIAFILMQFLKSPAEIMAWELRELPLTDEERERLVLFALEHARRDVALVPPYHNVLNVRMRVDIVHKHMIRGARDSVMSWVMRESFDAAAGRLKVPAAEAVVEMATREKVELSKTETCTICLEEVRQAAQMPCSHVFHGDCIGEWLRIDHRCPLCRFEMPVMGT